MTKNIRKLMAALLAVVMCMSLGTTALAAGPSSDYDLGLPADLETATCKESGIDFNLYNYNSNINLKYAVDGKAATADYTVLSKYFNFDGSGETNRTGSSAVGDLGKGHLTYERNLVDGAPVITLASITKEDDKQPLAATEARNIGYVFSDGHFGVTAYEDILNTPLTYNPETGYYEYDSAENAVDFDEDNNMVYVRSYLERGDASADANAKFDDDDSLADFFPFNSRIQTGENGEITFVEDSETYAVNGVSFHFDGTYGNKSIQDEDLEKPDYWFGASMSAEFFYPQNGYWMGNPMKYEFSGDDDVMVYIDGIYVMDLGGAHSRASGEIDFATGLVETWLDAANKTALYPAGRSYDHREWAAEAAAGNKLTQDDDGYYYEDGLLIRYYPTTIYECYKAAYEEQGLDADTVAAKLAEVFVKIEDETVEDAYGNEHEVYRFRLNSVHTFDWFYLERHSWEANFYTKFNLPTLAEGEEPTPEIPEIPVISFESGDASNISFMLIDEEGKVEFLEKIDIEDETSFEIPTEEGKVSAVFVKQSTSGMFWFSEEVEEDVIQATIECLANNNPSYKGYNAMAYGAGDHKLEFKTGKFVTYTFTGCDDGGELTFDDTVSEEIVVENNKDNKNNKYDKNNKNDKNNKKNK